MSENIKFKSHRYGGFDYSFNNLETFASVKMIWNTTTSQIFKQNKQAFVGMKEALDDGDIIELGTFKVLYRVIRHVRKDPKLSNVYAIVRVDGSLITGFDIDSSKAGQRIRVKNRRSFEDIFDDFTIFNKEDEQL